MKKRLPFLKRAQRGQTIVILAFAFIVLLGFVGLVTDISLMFVRYNTLRRAVDAAAVAAAGQIRRTTPTTAETAQATAVGGTAQQISDRADGYAFARNIATVNLAARQFIEFYGLSPSAVLVDTCATLPSDPDLQCLPDPITGKFPPVRKLVKVTAQLQSPTVFLRLLGWPTVLLEATSISETAVLDVVLIFDSSESMANQTSYDDWAAVPDDQSPGAFKDYSMHYYAPRMTQSVGGTIAGSGQDQYKTVAERMFPPPTYSSPDYNGAWINVLAMTQQQIDSNPTMFPIIPYTADAANNITIRSLTDPRNPPNSACRVRFFPSGNTITIPYGGTTRTPVLYATGDDVWTEYGKLLRQQGIFTATQNFNTRYDSFLPTYNYFGCCNDPNQNFDFTDLVCQPFQDMRERTEDFLKRIDFNRGDRVAFVTFDRYAFLIDPDGDNGPQQTMITTQKNAIDALHHDVGVRAENSYYADTSINGTSTLVSDGKWDSYVLGGPPYNPSDPAHSGTPYLTDKHLNVATKTWVAGGYETTPVGQMTDYAVKDNCRFQNAGLPYPYSIYSSPAPELATLARPYIAQRFPTPLAAFGQPATKFPPTQSSYPAPSAFTSPPTVMLPNLNDPAWDSQMTKWPAQDTSNPPPDYTSYARELAKPQYSYEAAAGCNNSNVGAALRVGNNALLNPNTKRTNGAVWVMVMLGDGAAGGSDPVRRNGGELIAGDPYGNPTQPPALAGQYGAYGLCPYGTPGQPGALVDDNGKGPANRFDNTQPRCSDAYPETRNVGCFIPDQFHTDANSNIFIDLKDGVNCETTYDVDDYARDWADYVALADPDFGVATDASNKRNAQQLPTIFTIGFGLDFQNGNGTGPENVPDFLGEELLRYVADAGDNQRLDTDYQQDKKNDGIMNGVLTLGETTYGDRGPCEGPVLGYASADAASAASDYSALLNPLPPKTSCGNYYWAPDANHLQQVFDDIASRMFTRLTR